MGRCTRLAQAAERSTTELAILDTILNPDDRAGRGRIAPRESSLAGQPEVATSKSAFSGREASTLLKKSYGEAETAGILRVPTREPSGAANGSGSSLQPQTFGRDLVDVDHRGPSSSPTTDTRGPSVSTKPRMRPTNAAAQGRGKASAYRAALSETDNIACLVVLS